MALAPHGEVSFPTVQYPQRFGGLHPAMRAATFMFLLLAAGATQGQNLITNGTFDRDLGGWTVDRYTVWSSRDANGVPSSGSAKMDIGVSGFAIFQRLLPAPGAYRLSGKLFLE